jgi:hypothetical protein
MDIVDAAVDLVALASATGIPARQVEAGIASNPANRIELPISRT